MEILTKHIANLRKALNDNKEFDLSKVSDPFSFEISITYIDNLIKNEQLSEEEFKKALFAERLICS